MKACDRADQGGGEQLVPAGRFGSQLSGHGTSGGRGSSVTKAVGMIEDMSYLGPASSLQQPEYNFWWMGA